jgi:citrate lyase subunit beta/citryl-CoA lyase
MLETARGILQAPEILSARAGIPAAVFGAEDLTAELGIPRTLEGQELLYARSRIVLAAATIGADAIDAIWVRFKDADGLREDARRARALGFRGKTLIHPAQVPIVNDVFSPTAEEVERAQEVVEADDRARAAGAGAFRLNDEMVDAPVVTRARRVLAVADQLRRR